MPVGIGLKCSIESDDTSDDQRVHNDDSNGRNGNGQKGFEHIDKTHHLVIIKKRIASTTDGPCNINRRCDVEIDITSSNITSRCLAAAGYSCGE